MPLQIAVDGVIMDEVSSKEFYAAFADLGDRVEARIDTRFGTLEHKLDEHAAEDRLVANRVLTMETQRASEAADAAKRMTWTVLGMTTGAAVVLEVLKRFFK